MDYEKKYNKLVEAVKVLQETNPSDEGIQNWVNDNVPELQESEDERIRKALINFLKSPFVKENITDEKVAPWLAWLEKLKVFAEHGDGLYHFGNNGFTYVGNPTWDNVSWLEKQGGVDNCPLEGSADCVTTDSRKQGEQNHSEQDLEMVAKPKFNIGDWITSDETYIINDYRLCKVVGIGDGCYTIQTIDGLKGYNTFKRWESDYRLWSIEDAKDGDVLAEYSCIFIIQKLGDNNTAAKTYCTLYGDGDFDDGTILSFDINSTKPATKEQRNLLFQKMREAGYMWDAEKKLKKIEQKPVEWKQENREELTEFENAMMHIGGSFFGENAGLDPNDTDTIKEQAELLLELAPKTEWSEEDRTMAFTLMRDVDQMSYISKEGKNERIGWLNSLDEKFVSTESSWSEEDERIYQSIIDDTVQENQLDDKQISWLKSFKLKRRNSL